MIGEVHTVLNEFMLGCEFGLGLGLGSLPKTI